MKAYEILHQFTDENAGEIFQHLYEQDKPAYKACVQVLAARRKLRPVILERKSRAERHAWMRGELAKKINDDASTEVLQTWLLGAHQALICQFLDALNVPHNGNGLLETLPEEPDKAKVLEAIDQLFKNHSTVAVFAYLHLFAEMDIAEWPSLKEILNQDSRLCPAQPTPATP